jgi:hypothetical protein
MTGAAAVMGLGATEPPAGPDLPPDRWACHHGGMSPDNDGPESFEEKIRSIAREFSRSIERVVQGDLQEIAEAIGVDPARANEWVDTAVGWVRAHAEGLSDEAAVWGADLADQAAGTERPRRAGPHPMDLPTGDQGLALAALDSGRWRVGPGSQVLAATGEGPGPSDALGLVGELRARDWISADGEVTLVGRHALSRWLDGDNVG